MTWRVAKSLEILLAQINALAPNRDKSSDGSIGDLRHQHESSSDHNPHIIDDNGIGVVTARDFTNDIAHGINSEEIAEALRTVQDARIKYIISNKKIASPYPTDGKPAWAWRFYTGVNPHNHHVHVSVLGDKLHYDSVAPWKLELRPIADAPPSSEVLILRKGDKGAEVIKLQAALNSKGFSLKEDGYFGVATEDTVKIWQAKNALVADGIVGRYTQDALGMVA